MATRPLSELISNDAQRGLAAANSPGTENAFATLADIGPATAIKTATGVITPIGPGPANAGAVLTLNEDGAEANWMVPQSSGGGGGSSATYAVLTSDFNLASLNAGQGGPIPALTVTLTAGQTWHYRAFILYNSIDGGNPNTISLIRSPSALTPSATERIIMSAKMELMNSGQGDSPRSGFYRGGANTLSVLGGIGPGSGLFMIEMEGTYYTTVDDVSLTVNMSRGGGYMGTVYAGAFFRAERAS